MSRKKINEIKSYGYYGVQDVIQIFGCSRSYAYGFIKKLRKELINMNKEPGPAGKISKKYFREKVYLDENDLPDIRPKKRGGDSGVA